MITRTRQQYSPYGRPEGIAVEVWTDGRWVSRFIQLTPEKAAEAQRKLMSHPLPERIEMSTEYERNLYHLHDGSGRYYGWTKKPTRRFAGEMGLVPRANAFRFHEAQHPSAAAKAQLEREYGSEFHIERTAERVR